MLFAYGTSTAGKAYTNRETSQLPGIIPCANNILFNIICEMQSETYMPKPDMFIGVVESEDKLVQQ
jgi:hypothetical protein